MSSKRLGSNELSKILSDMEASGEFRNEGDSSVCSESVDYESYRDSFRYLSVIFYLCVSLTIFFVCLSWFFILTLPETQYFTTDMAGNINQVFPND